MLQTKIQKNSVCSFFHCFTKNQNILLYLPTQQFNEMNSMKTINKTYRNLKRRDTYPC